MDSLENKTYRASADHVERHHFEVDTELTYAGEFGVSIVTPEGDVLPLYLWEGKGRDHGRTIIQILPLRYVDVSP